MFGRGVICLHDLCRRTCPYRYWIGLKSWFKWCEDLSKLAPQIFLPRISCVLYFHSYRWIAERKDGLLEIWHYHNFMKLLISHNTGNNPWQAVLFLGSWSSNNCFHSFGKKSILPDQRFPVSLERVILAVIWLLSRQVILVLVLGKWILHINTHKRWKLFIQAFKSSNWTFRLQYRSIRSCSIRYFSILSCNFSAFESS